jgi:histidine triad (HIT) family protein
VPTLFSRIIAGEIPCHKVAEDHDFIAFLDIQPVAIGHVLVVPKNEVDYIFDLDDSLLSGINLFSKKVARGIQDVVPCKRIGVSVIGLEVPHCHMHLIPLNSLSDTNFSKERVKMTSEDLARLASEINAAILSRA